MILDSTIPKTDAIAELRNVGARYGVWGPGPGGRSTIYVNGPRREKLGEIWCTSTGLVCDVQLWSAIHAHVTNRTEAQR